MRYNLGQIRGLAPLAPGDVGYIGSRHESQQSIRSSLLDEAAAMHEAAHCLFSVLNNQQIFDISIHKQGLGGGEFRNVPHARDISEGDVKQQAGQQISLMTAALDPETSRVWA
jgi:hypothetical protein